jgi:hypothetical protein
LGKFKNRGLCYYNNDANNGTTYGKLYNWYAVMGIVGRVSNTNNCRTTCKEKISPNRLACSHRVIDYIDLLEEKPLQEEK